MGRLKVLYQLNIRISIMANAIKYWRNKRNVTQQKLADKIGIDRPTLSKIENENIPLEPDEELAEKIARILKVLPTDILRRPPEVKNGK